MFSSEVAVVEVLMKEVVEVLVEWLQQQTKLFLHLL
jgi:hypothetical protein